MRFGRRALTAVGVLAATAGIAAAATPSVADTNSKFVRVVKDQAGGAYYNLVTGERFDVTAASAVPSLAEAGIKFTGGLILTETGDLLVPVGGTVDGSPAATVVEVAETTEYGTYQSAVDGALFAVQTAGGILPAGNEYAIQLATGTIITINNEVLLP